MVSNVGIDVDSMMNPTIGVGQLIKLMMAGIIVLQLVSFFFVSPVLDNMYCDNIMGLAWVNCLIYS